MNTDTHTSGSTVKNHISLKTVFEYSVIRKIPIVVPGLSPSSSSSLSTSTPMTSSTEIGHSDLPPAIVSSESVDRQARRDPFTSETSEELSATFSAPNR